MKFSRKKGFTLIELLVVISIIGLLTSVILVALQSARLNARDIQRISDLRQIQNALQLYYVDHNGTYPLTSSTNNASNDWGPLFKAALVPTYISKLPVDPINDGSNPDVTLRYYYHFWNPSGSPIGNCTASSVVLGNLAEVNSKRYSKQCGLNLSRWTSIVLQQ